MGIVTVDELKQQLNITADLGSADDALLARKLAAAQDHVERLLGFRIATTYGGEGQDPIPPSLIEAVGQLAAHWYENREASSPTALQTIPYGVQQIVAEYREYSFDG